jgi:hypothetical protein
MDFDFPGLFCQGTVRYKQLHTDASGIPREIRESAEFHRQTLEWWTAVSCAFVELMHENDMAVDQSRQLDVRACQEGAYDLTIEFSEREATQKERNDEERDRLAEANARMVADARRLRQQKEAQRRDQQEEARQRARVGICNVF